MLIRKRPSLHELEWAVLPVQTYWKTFLKIEVCELSHERDLFYWFGWHATTCKEENGIQVCLCGSGHIESISMCSWCLIKKFERLHWGTKKIYMQQLGNGMLQKIFQENFGLINVEILSMTLHSCARRTAHKITLREAKQSLPRRRVTLEHWNLSFSEIYRIKTLLVTSINLTKVFPSYTIELIVRLSWLK